ncbi:DUF4376 domain-containing protein [Brucella intermedia]|uniref:DUF4376 domain-containing protein n=1 Tax=Brucella intermedia TaxID=94625 RepID=UPI00178C8288|nr:DUF4376 domain-containing protein [Brucella intermedia]
MAEATKVIIDEDRRGTKGFPRYAEALGIEPPTKVVPVEDEIPQAHHPGLTLAEYAAAKRWEKETGGLVIGGLTVSTDDRSKVMISGARVAAMADPSFATAWKASNGEFVPLNANAVIAISDAVLAHVTGCFAIEAEVLTGIESGIITSPAQIDAAFA